MAATKNERIELRNRHLTVAEKKKVFTNASLLGEERAKNLGTVIRRRGLLKRGRALFGKTGEGRSRKKNKRVKHSMSREIS